MEDLQESHKNQEMLTCDEFKPLNSTNGTCPWVDCAEQVTSPDVVAFSLLLVTLITFLANLLLLGLILWHKNLRGKRYNQFIISLGVSDMINTVQMLVSHQGMFAKGRLIRFLSSDPEVCRALHIVQVILFMSSWFNFLGLMLDRLYAIKWPLEYREKLKKQHISRIIPFCWLAALLPTLPLLWDRTLVEDFNAGCKCYLPLRNKVWLFWSCFVGVIVPATVILIIWIMMAHHFATQRTNSLLKKGTLKMVFITMLFLVTSAPLSSQFISAALVTPKSTRMLDFTFLIAYLNSMAQPIVCICIVTEIRETLVRLVLQKEDNRAEGMRERGGSH